ncbi:DUF58 domain-containing protein [Thermococcus sp. 18S1]|uniref:DUF58 domain-containing protein n=1 Tax=Thermococcus sp. 18S1 TaxID=1638210 RepID=UPI00143AC776|nr:DUF58 domain-containing protein [Thermococcus sp. 18S1]NJE30310.1 DUF58 domain-containing protein [Thermococcus sp. 18S1]
MKRAEVVLSLAAVAGATAYLTGSPAGALVAAMMMAHYALARLGFTPDVRIVRELPAKGMEKEPVKARIEVINESNMGGTLHIAETSEKLFARGLKIPLRPGERKYLEQTIVPQSKGRVRPKARAVFEDPLGLFRKEFPVDEHGEMTVLPSLRSIREAMRERHHVEALAEAEKALGVGAEVLDFEELREFLPGDDISKIDWKATSRLQTIIVRVFKRETLSDIYILVNVDGKFRREIKRGKIDYLVLIITQLTAYFRKFGHTVRVVAYDDAGVVGVIEHAADPLIVTSKLDLREEKGLPPLRPASPSPASSIGKLALKLRRGSTATGVVKAAMGIEPGAYVVMVDDLGLHPGEIIKAARILRRKGNKAVLIYPNPILFADRKGLGERELESLYTAYRERKRVMRKVMGWINVIEVGPGDVLPKVVRRL